MISGADLNYPFSAFINGKMLFLLYEPFTNGEGIKKGLAVKKKKTRTPGLFWPGTVLTVLIIFCLRDRRAGDFYASHLYPTVSSALSLAASPFGFSLQMLMMAAFITAFIWIIVRNCHRRMGFFQCMLKIATLVVWIFIWAYLGWCLNYSRSPVTTRTGASCAAYDSTAFRAFLSEFTDKMNASWIPDVTMEETVMEKEIKDFYESVPRKYGLCSPRSWQHPKRMPLHRIESAMGILGYMGPFFCESHLNPDIPPVEVPNTFAHEFSHLLGVSSEAEANWWAFQCCSRSSEPVMKYSGYLCMLPAVAGNASRLLSEEDFHEWAGTIRHEVKDDYNSNREFWNSKRNRALDNVQKWIYDLFLKGNNISSGIMNYSEAVGLMMSLEYESD